MLAKSNPRLTLQEHIEDCLHIWACLQRCFPSAAGLRGAPADFWTMLRRCIILHDLGKTHREFQRLLAAPDQPNQWLRQRHELFSMPFVEGLCGVTPEEHQLIRLVVAGHHKDFKRLLNDYISTTYRDSSGWDNGLHEKRDFQEEFERNVDEAWVLDFLRKDTFNLNVTASGRFDPYLLIGAYNRDSQWFNLHDNEQAFALLLAVGAFKSCDHLGSARMRDLPVLTANHFAFLDAKRAEIQLRGHDFYPHQLACVDVRGNLILTAPTGSGKTESAMMWARKQIELRGAGRVFYVLPFTASINAMFERLGREEEGFGLDMVGMLHGKLSDYLYQFFEDNQFTVEERNAEINALKERFKTLAMPVKVVTPFQLLKSLFGLRGFEQGFFEWAGGLFIFDEIHAYDPEAFAQIIALMEFATQRMGVQIMVMTATLPSFMRRELELVLQPFTSVFADTVLMQAFDRHRLRLEPGLLTDHLNKILAALQSQQKVLVVCNTVKNAQEVYRALHSKVKRAVLLHGGFNGEDRSRHEKALKLGEKDTTNPIHLLVGTQAIEVSLDIDYDIIFTEPAPIDPLIQRFGRVNRRREKGICEVVVFEQSNESDRFIYPQEVTRRTLEVLKKILVEDEGLIREQQLQDHINKVYPGWNDKHKRDFDRVLESLRASVRALTPLLPDKKREEDFYRQFDGVKVLPASLLAKFVTCVRKFDFVQAESLKVQIRKGKFAQLSKDPDILRKHICPIAKSQGEGVLEIDFFEIAVKYDPELGLLYDEQESFSIDHQFGL